jgi:hypothetical protein
VTAELELITPMWISARATGSGAPGQIRRSSAAAPPEHHIMVSTQARVGQHAGRVVPRRWICCLSAIDRELSIMGRSAFVAVTGGGTTPLPVLPGLKSGAGSPPRKLGCRARLHRATGVTPTVAPPSRAACAEIQSIEEGFHEWFPFRRSNPGQRSPVAP